MALVKLVTPAPTWATNAKPAELLVERKISKRFSLLELSCHADGVGKARIPNRVNSADAIEIGFAGDQPVIAEAGDVRCHLADLREADAAIG